MVDEWIFTGVKGYEFAETVLAGADEDHSKPLKDWFPDLGQSEFVKLKIAAIDCWLADNPTYPSESAELTIKSSNRSLDIQAFTVEQGGSKSWLENLPEKPELSMLDAIEMYLDNADNTGDHVFTVQFQFLVYRKVTFELG